VQGKQFQAEWRGDQSQLGESLTASQMPPHLGAARTQAGRDSTRTSGQPDLSMSTSTPKSDRCMYPFFLSAGKGHVGLAFGASKGQAPRRIVCAGQIKMHSLMRHSRNASSRICQIDPCPLGTFPFGPHLRLRSSSMRRFCIMV
jgi:hypothetical protein